MSRTALKIPAGWRHQGGAAALMTVLFLLIVVAFAVLAAISLSGSDITDTSVQEAGVSTLLLAESGLERASARYIGGTACASLAVDGPYNLGQGSFTITLANTKDFSGAPLPAGQCHVRSVGTVGAASRTVEGILQLPVAFVVGNSGVALRCISFTCTSTPTGVATNLTGVYCVTASDCWAVGSKTAIHWNGSRWTSTALPFNAVSIACAPGNGSSCFAVGSDLSRPKGYVYQWNGTSWTIAYLSGLYPYTDVACPTTVCYAVGGTVNNPYSYFISKYNGSAWTNVVSGPRSGFRLNGVSCASATTCWAVGTKPKKGPKIFVDGLSGGAWNPQNPRVSFATNLNKVSCATTTDCWAAGDSTGMATFDYWNGSRWAGTQTSSSSQSMHGIGCLSVSECWAVGANGTVLHGTGVGGGRVWTSVSSATTKQLNAVSVDRGSAVVVRWRTVVF